MELCPKDNHGGQRDWQYGRKDRQTGEGDRVLAMSKRESCP